MARPWRTPKVLWLLSAAGAFVPLFAGLVDSGARGARARPELPPLVEPPDAPRGPELCLAPALAPLEEVEAEQPAPHPAAQASHSPAAFARITGVVLRPDGEPATGARILLDQQQARCDDDGRFVLELAAATDSDLVAFEPGFEPTVRPHFGADLTRASDSAVELLLGPPTLTLSGRVVDRAGNPLEGWNVELDERDSLTALGLRPGVRSDDAGCFQVPDVSAGAHVLRAWKSAGGIVVHSPSVEAGSIGLVLVADPVE